MDAYVHDQVCVWKSKSRINHAVNPVGISFPAKVLQVLRSWRVEIGQGYRSTRREENVARIRVFRLLATPVRFGRNERGGGGGAFGTTGPPTLLVPLFPPLHPRPAPPPPFYPSAVPFHARLVGDSRGRAFSSLISLFGPPSVPFHFCFCVGYASTSVDTRNTWTLSIDSIFVENRDQYFHIYWWI